MPNYGAHTNVMHETELQLHKSLIIWNNLGGGGYTCVF